MKYSIVLLGVFLISMCACKKYLDEKPDQSLVVPSTIKDLQALLDNNGRLNKDNPSWGVACSDDYFLPPNVYNNDLYDLERQAYIWSVKDYSGYPNDWARIYNQVYITNVVLEQIGTIEKNALNKEAWNNIKGSALVFRAQSFLRASILFSKAYDNVTAEVDLGIVLRLNSDFNAASLRSSNSDCYKRIIEDLKEAMGLLPDVAQHVMRPSKPAAYALLSRTYLSMRIYDSAWKYADLGLQINGQLLNYNDLNVNANFPFPRFNKEVIFHSTIGAYKFSNGHPLYGKVDSTLYASYEVNDLRKLAFFRLRIAPNIYGFKGVYSGENDLYVGVANDEVYLMRAECYARKGDVAAAMNDLNKLMVTRWKTGFFIPFEATTSAEALAIILQERRKQLLLRDLRWMDIKRLNKEGFNIILKRIVAGQSYLLMPNENRYALQLPLDIVNITGMAQNPW